MRRRGTSGRARWGGGLLSAGLLMAMTVGASWPVPTVTPPAGIVMVPKALEGTIREAPVVSREHLMRLGFVLGPSHPAALARYDTAVSSPGSPLYHHFLPVAQTNARFGPQSAVVEADRRALSQMGYTQVAREGWILYATANASAIRESLGVVLHRARVRGVSWIAPSGGVHLPPTLQDVRTVTGLETHATVAARAIHGERPVQVRRVHVRLRHAAATSGVDGYTVTTSWLPKSPVETGLPATARIVVASPNGQSDFRMTVGSPIEHGPGNMWTTGTTGPDFHGAMGYTVTANRRGRYTLRVTITPGRGAAPFQVTLPPVSFTGATVAAGFPASPALVTRALGASGVVRQASSSKSPPTVGLYAEASPDLTDLTFFEEINNLKPIHIKMAPVDGYAPPSPPLNVQSGPGMELALDLESVAMAAPGATVVVSPVPPSLAWSDGVVQAMNAAQAADKVSVFALSFGSPEESGGLVSNIWSSHDLRALQAAIEAANVEGMTVVSAAGDNGAYTTTGNESFPVSPAVSVPSSIPQVTAVGGIDFRTTRKGTGFASSYWGGDAWEAVSRGLLQYLVSQPSGGGNLLGGGGYSQFFPTPSWQRGLLPAGETGRGVPDIAFPASKAFPGVAMMFDGSSTERGGTSMAAPLFAAYLADIAVIDRERFGNLNPALYAAARHNPTLMTQAQYGYDGLWSIHGAGWNPLTGLGTPNVGQLARDLATLTPRAIRFKRSAELP